MKIPDYLKKRIKNKAFWLALVPAFLLVIQTLAMPFGYNFDIDGISKELLDVVNAVFALLTILGVVNDPTTKGFSDKEEK